MARISRNVSPATGRASSMALNESIRSRPASRHSAGVRTS